jgi:fatty acid desaturase
MASISRRHDALFRLQSFLTKAPKNPKQKRWERRWVAALGASFAVLAALLLGGIDWRAALMVTATAFMLARGGDMLDNYDESPLPSPAVPALLPVPWTLARNR